MGTRGREIGWGDIGEADRKHRQMMEIGSVTLLKALDRFFTERRRAMGKRMIG